MATTIKLKNGSGAPLAGDLVQGEPALDLTNKRLYTEDSLGAVIEIGTNPTSLTTGTFTSTGIDDNATSTKLTVADSAITTGSIDQLIVAHSTDGGGIRIDSTNSTNTGSLRFGDDLDNYIGALEYNHTSNAMSMYVNNATRMTIDSSGNVGIGTTSPAGPLHINSASDTYFYIGTTNATADARIQFRNSAGTDAGGLWYANTGNSMLFRTNSAERMRIDSNGQTMLSGSTAGFDNTGAVNGLQFHYTTTTGKGVIGTYSSGGTTSLAFRTNSGGAGAATDHMLIDGSGNVGIGTSSPGYKLQLNSVGDNDGLLIKSGSPAYINYLLFGDSGSNTVGRLGYNHANNSMTFFTVDSERMRISSAGFVGIGTSSPDRYLHVNQSRSGDWLAEIHNTHTTNGYGLKVRAGDDANVTAMRVVDVNNTTIMEIQGGGNVGIGTTSPLYELSQHVSDSGANYHQFTNLTTGTGAADGFLVGIGGDEEATLWNYENTHMRFATNSAERMRIANDGGVFVNTTSTPSSSNFGTTLGRSGNPGLIESYRNQSGTGTVANFGGTAGNALIKGDGDLENTNNSYGAISDERLKSNIVDASSQIDDIMAVQVRSYTLNETGDTHIGVVAQELEASGMSGLVQEDEEGMKSVKYSILYMKAIKALQEAVTRIETLEAEVAALKGA